MVEAYEEIFTTEGMKGVQDTRTYPPVANAFTERGIGTLRCELLDRTIIWNHRKFNKLVVDYIDHNHAH